MIIEALIYLIIAIMLMLNLIKKYKVSRKMICVIGIMVQLIGLFIGIASLITGNIYVIKYVLGVIFPLIILSKKENSTEMFDSLVRKAELLIGNGELETAKTILLELQEKHSDFYIHKLLAKIYEIEEKNVRAIEESIVAININEKDYESYYVAARNSEKINKNEEAKIFLRDVLDKEPNMLESIELLGQILINEGNYNEAIDIYQEALKNNPGNYELLLDLGIAYTFLNDFDTAKGFYDMAAEVNSMKHVLEYTSAQINLIYKEYDEAEKKFMELTEDEELSADAYFELSRIYLMKKDKETALRYITLALEVNQKKILKKIQGDSIFISIITKIRLEEKGVELDNENEELEIEDEDIQVEEITEKEQNLIDYLDEIVTYTVKMTKEEVLELKEERIDIYQRKSMKEKELDKEKEN